MQPYFPAEWHPQQAIQITWPHKETDWAWVINEAHAFYYKLARAILMFQNLIISVPTNALKRELQNAFKGNPHQCFIYVCPSNDTWTRDHGPVSVFNGSLLQILDYQFNGWGNKFNAELDNQITTNLYKQGAYTCDSMLNSDFILEGGSIETDGQGTLLTTKQCLLNTNRNPDYSRHQIESLFTKQLGCTNILWLDHGNLIGDDTDAHIDTLARFIPNNGIIFQGCQDPLDPHYQSLNKMKGQLKTFKNSCDQPYTLHELPLPSAIYESSNSNPKQRLPASYANFLIANKAIFLPIYNVPQDTIAIEILKKALPNHKIMPIDCTLLIRQYGSLHCITMQIPIATRTYS
jgi:agmatine deiminase